MGIDRLIKNDDSILIFHSSFLIGNAGPDSGFGFENAFPQ